MTLPTAPNPPACAAHSRLVQRVRRRYAAELGLLAEGAPERHGITALVHALQARAEPPRDLPAALRVARHLVIERLAVLDVEQAAPLEVVTRGMTALAEATLELALAQAQAEADARHGPALNARGEPMDLWVVGMGKLGARELNVSSDIDLVYVYEEEGQTHGARPVSFHEYFGFVAKRLYALIGEVTEDGFVFRVDLALRPNGNSGPAVVSLAMLEEYFQAHGREWERLAWLKSRVVAPLVAVQSGRALALRALVTPFVYRRYLDYAVVESLRQLHQRIRGEAQRRAAGRPERANDVKLARGGIREIEFTVQLLQVVRGGQTPEIRRRRTLAALPLLVQRGLMTARAAQDLGQAYVFLRRLEHRIQYLDDQQTHVLPTQDEDLLWIARSMGLPVPVPGWKADAGAGADTDTDTDTDARAQTAALLDQLSQVREAVAAEFNALLQEGQGSVGAPAPRGAVPGPGCAVCSSGPQAIDDERLLEPLTPEFAARVAQFAQSPRVQTLRDETRQRLGRLVQRTGEAVAAGVCSEAAALRFMDWVQPLLRRESYIALLAERPAVLQRLLRLLGLARWPMRYLMLHPSMIDELADERQLHERFDRANFEAELEQRRAAWQRHGEDDEGALLDTLRHAHHAEVFRILVRDVEGRLSVEQVADELSALADTVLDLVLRWAWQRVKQRPAIRVGLNAQQGPSPANGVAGGIEANVSNGVIEPAVDSPALAVIAYGKLGGKELGYGSDLDVVFLYDEALAPDAAAGAAVDPAGQSHAPNTGPSAQELYGAFVRKVITWLTVRTAAGELFDIDTALRPNGNAGLLVTSVAAFDRYQVGRGSNTAWTWEHQALTRARFAAGRPEMAVRFEATRRAVLAAPRDHAALREEVRSMRERVRAAHAVPADRFDVKHSAGGMMDVEFAVQFLVLAESAAHPELLDNAGNIALLERAETAGLLPAGVGQAAADAYRDLRRAQHKARLDEQPTQVALAELGPLAAHRQAVLVLWQVVFG